jgi:hypothetical protein
MANLFCYLAGIIMLVPAFLLDVVIKVIYAVYYIGYISIMSFINPTKARACRYDYDYKYIAFGLKFFFSEKAIEFYFKN